MLKKYLVISLTIFVLNLFLSTSILAAGADREKEAKFIEKVRASVTKLGTGKDARVEVKLKDGTKLKGYISQINEGSFFVVNEKSGEATEVPYPQTKQVKGNNLSTGAKIAIGVGILVVVVVILALATRSS